MTHDDVIEQVARVITAARYNGCPLEDLADEDLEKALAEARALAAAGLLARPVTVTAEPEWEWCIAYPDQYGALLTDGIDPFATRDEAEADLESGDYLESDRVVRRRKAGPWEEVSR